MSKPHYLVVAPTAAEQQMKRKCVGTSFLALPGASELKFGGKRAIQRVRRAALGLLTVLSALGPITAHATERYVDPSQKAAVDSGTGTAAVPFKTVSYAMSRLQPGDHLIIMPGTYRDAMVFPNRAWSAAQPTLIEGEGEVLIKGSDVVQGWQSLGGDLFAVPWTSEPEQVFFDSKSLQQIAGTVFSGFPLQPGNVMNGQLSSNGGIWPGRVAGNASSMPENSFFFDAAASKLYVRIAEPNLIQHTMEVSTRQYGAFGINVSGVTLHNLAFQHGNTSITSRMGFVTMIGNNITLNFIRVSQTDSIGIQLSGNNNTVRQSYANQCGQLGMKAWGNQLLFENNQTNGNNTRLFNKSWEAGGIKFVGDGGAQNSIIRNHQSLSNLGQGMWFDWDNVNNIVDSSDIRYNTGMGIMYEKSFGGTLVRNVVVGNGERGIYLPSSSTTTVAFNLVADSGMQGVVVVDDGTIDPTGKLDFRPKGNHVFGNVVAWNEGGSVVLPKVIATNTSDYNSYIDATDNVAISLGWGGVSATTLQRWSGLTGQDTHSQSQVMASDPQMEASIKAQSATLNVAWFAKLLPTFTQVPFSEHSGIVVTPPLSTGTGAIAAGPVH
jgi:coenzyme F420-reducing hydrogenase delta subunit